MKDQEGLLSASGSVTSEKEQLAIKRGSHFSAARVLVLIACGV